MLQCPRSKHENLKFACVLVPIPPGEVLEGVRGLEAKGDEVSFRLQGIVQLGEQGHRAVPAVDGVPHPTGEGLLTEEGAIGAEEGNLDIAAARVGDAHVVHLASGSCVCVETSVDSFRARELCVWQIVLVIHWEVNPSFTKGVGKTKIVVGTVDPLGFLFWSPLQRHRSGGQAGQLLPCDDIKIGK